MHHVTLGVKRAPTAPGSRTRASQNSQRRKAARKCSPVHIGERCAVFGSESARNLWTKPRNGRNRMHDWAVPVGVRDEAAWVRPVLCMQPSVWAQCGDQVMSSGSHKESRSDHNAGHCVATTAARGARPAQTRDTQRAQRKADVRAQPALRRVPQIDRNPTRASDWARLASLERSGRAS
jgi:hypothetical protein